MLVRPKPRVPNSSQAAASTSLRLAAERDDAGAGRVGRFSGVDIVRVRILRQPGKAQRNVPFVSVRGPNADPSARRHRGSELSAFDLLDPAIQAEPFAYYQWLREHEPVHLAPWRKGQRGHVLSRHDDVQAALRDPETFSSAVAPAAILMFNDPPEHTRLRETLQRAFTPRAIDALAPRIDMLASELVDAYLAAGGVDFVDAVAHLLPALVIGEMLGVAADR
jgi:cytochrome P450